MSELLIWHQQPAAAEADRAAYRQALCRLADLMDELGIIQIKADAPYNTPGCVVHIAFKPIRDDDGRTLRGGGCYEANAFTASELRGDNVEPSVRHGRDCRKKLHRGGELHAEDDDAPFSVDGVMYCGRCHMAL